MLEKIEKPELDTVDLRSDGKYGKFVLAPLERGYGITLGNSLRRVFALLIARCGCEFRED